MAIRSFFRRHLNILDYAVASLSRKKRKNSGIFLILTLVVFLFSSFQILTRGLSDVARSLVGSGPDITVQQMSAGRQVSIDSSIASDLRSIYGISRIRKRIWGYYFDEKNGANYTVMGVAPETMAMLKSTDLATGRYPESGNEGEVVLSALVRDKLGLGERRRFSLFRPDLSQASFILTGVFTESTSLGTADLMLMSMADARNLFALPEPLVTDILLYVANPREVDTIAAKVAERVAGSRVVTKSQLLKTYDVVFNWRSGFGAVCLLSTLAAFVILAYDKASGLGREDFREAGILKILGWQTADVMLIRFWESTIVAMFAFTAGYSLAWLHIVWGKAAFFAPLMLGWSVLRPELRIVPSFSLAELVVIFSLSVLPYLCATIVPAWRSGVVRPDTVL